MVQLSDKQSQRLEKLFAEMEESNVALDATILGAAPMTEFVPPGIIARSKEALKSIENIMKTTQDKVTSKKAEKGSMPTFFKDIKAPKAAADQCEQRLQGLMDAANEDA